MGIEAQRRLLKKTIYQDYLLRHVGMTTDALPYFLGRGYRNNMRVDTCPAYTAAEHGAPGFDGLALRVPPLWQAPHYTFHFPDGNASITRLLAARLVPAVAPQPQTMESVVEAPFDYARLDDGASPVRIRLNSTVVRVSHDGPPASAQSITVGYVRDGKVHGVRGRNCVLACWNQVIPYLMPELPRRQREALTGPSKVPMLYTNVFLRNWKAFERLGVSRVRCPGMYHTGFNLDTPVSIGGYRCSQSPEEPIVVHMTRNPNRPGLPRRMQQRAGMEELLSTPFEEIELKIRDQLGRALAGGGFDPSEDILGISANRWPHGYAYTPDTLADPDLPESQQEHVIGRQPFGLVTIANADAGAAAFTNTAIDQAHRSVQEIIRQRGLK